MKTLSNLDAVKLPKPVANLPYSINMHGRSYTFSDLKHVLGSADISKAGDRKAGLAATDEIMR